jgi:hypothetical protein
MLSNGQTAISAADWKRFEHLSAGGIPTCSVGFIATYNRQLLREVTDRANDRSGASDQHESGGPRAPGKLLSIEVTLHLYVID